MRRERTQKIIAKEPFKFKQLAEICVRLVATYALILIGRGSMICETNEHRQNELRKKLKTHYLYLKKTKALAGDPRHGTEVSDIINEFVYAGMTFDQAEDILRRAGLEVLSRPSETHDSKRYATFDVVARIQPYERRPFSCVNLYVRLTPIKPLDYSVVDRISASFYIAAL